MRATAAIILAAGAGSRYGGAKPLAAFHGESLVRRAVNAAVAAHCAPVVVVAGAYMREIVEVLTETPARVVENRRWQAGLGGSIHAGLAALQAWEAVILMACDQPGVTVDTLNRLRQAAEQAPERIVAAAYADTLGVPVLFPAACRSWLENLPEGQGAKALLAAHPDLIAPVPAPEAAGDVDYPEDLARLMAAIPA